MARSIPQTLDAVAAAAEAVLPQHFGPRCCLNASRVLIDVLARRKINARPVSVKMTAFNAKWYELLRAKQGWPESQTESDEWAAQGGYAVGIDVDDLSGQDGWPGHLIVAAAGCIIDPSAGQVHRPQHKIIVPPVFGAAITEGFLDGKTPLVYELPEGGRISYMVRPDDRSYLDMPGFKRSPHNTEAARAVLDYMQNGRWTPVRFSSEVKYGRK